MSKKEVPIKINLSIKYSILSHQFASNKVLINLMLYPSTFFWNWFTYIFYLASNLINTNFKIYFAWYLLVIILLGIIIWITYNLAYKHNTTSID